MNGYIASIGAAVCRADFGKSVHVYVEMGPTPIDSAPRAEISCECRCVEIPQRLRHDGSGKKCTTDRSWTLPRESP